MKGRKKERVNRGGYKEVRRGIGEGRNRVRKECERK
jgi:hypothetical protein